MPVKLKDLEKAGITEDSLKALFTADEKDQSDELKSLKRRIFGRGMQGRTFNFDNYKVYHAIDLLWETPLRSHDAALMRSLQGRDFTKEGNKKILTEWAMSHLLIDRKDPKTGKVEKVLNLPRFLNVVVPLAAATTKTRAAKLTNDRMQYPLFKYEPRKTTPQNIAKCELITDYVETVGVWFDYRNTLQQAILKCCQYPNQLQFVQESWFSQHQGDDLEKEGIRYRLPHPSRTYYDLSHPISTFNTDSGCVFAGYWRVMPYRQIVGNKSLWNVDRITIGSDWRSTNDVFFNTVYPCTLMPAQFTPEFTSLDREQANLNTYNASFEDAGVVVTEHHEQIIPKDYGIGDYEYPVWFRFLVAADTTVIYCEPLVACGITYWGYDPDDSRLISPSLVQEVAPWEYLVSNLLTQMVVSVRQNFANLTFYDSDMVDEKIIESLKDINDTSFNALRMVPMSGRRNRAQQVRIDEALHTVQLPQRETTSVMQAITAAMNIMERCLVMSSQEAGGAASHEQSAEEVHLISTSTSTRLEYTGLAIDRAIEAWKRQIYNYSTEHGSEEVYGYVSADQNVTPEMLKKMGLLVEEGETSDRHIAVNGKRSKITIPIEYFAASRDGANRANQQGIAQQMMTLLQPLAGELSQAVGPDQVVALFNQWAEVSGLPRNYRLKSGTVALQSEQQKAEQEAGKQQELTALVQQIREFVEKNTEANNEGLMKTVSDKMIAPLVNGVKQAIDLGHQNQEVIAKLIAIIQATDGNQPEQPAVGADPQAGDPAAIAQPLPA